MALANNETLIFVNRSVLQSQEGLEKLRNFLRDNNIPKNTIISGYESYSIVTVPHKISQQNLTPADDIQSRNLAFHYFVQQKIIDGYIYASVESLQKITEELLAEFEFQYNQIDDLKRYCHNLEGLRLSQ